MIKPMARKLRFHKWRLLVLSFSILVLVGCGQKTETELPETAIPIQSPTQAAAPIGTAIPPVDSAQTPATQDTVAVPSATPTQEPSAALSTFHIIGSMFKLFSPTNHTVSEVGVVRALGTGEPGAWAIVNGTSVAVGDDGTFQFDLPLDEGPNTIEVLVANAGGKTKPGRASSHSFPASPLYRSACSIVGTVLKSASPASGFSE